MHNEKETKRSKQRRKRMDSKSCTTKKRQRINILQCTKEKEDYTQNDVLLQTGYKMHHAEPETATTTTAAAAAVPAVAAAIVVAAAATAVAAAVAAAAAPDYLRDCSAG